MPLAQSKTRLEKNIARDESGMLRLAAALNNLIQEQRQVAENYWLGTDEEILEKLNSNIPQTLETFERSKAFISAINEQADLLMPTLDALGRSELLAVRAQSGSRVDLKFDGKAFVFIPEPILTPQ